MGKLIEGFWDCPYCGEKRIGGLQMKCTNCGASRGEDIKFYMDDPKNYISEEKAKTISKNPDWLCSFCGAYNSDNNSECENCSATRTESEKNYFEIQKQKKLKEMEKKQQTEKINTDDDSDYSDDSDDSDDREIRDNVFNNNHYNDTLPEVATLSKEYRQVNWTKILQWSGITIGIVSLIVALFFLFMPKTQEGTVDGFAWSRSIAIEEYKTIDENGWVLPSGARLHYTKEEIRTYEDVIDHYETKTRTYTEQVIDHYETVVTGHKDNGNGTFSEITSQRPVYRTETRTETYQDPVYRKEPVYDTKYYYEIDKWVHKDDIDTSGNDKQPYWGQYQYGNKEREGKKTEKYELIIINQDNEKKTYTVDYKVWQGLNKGETVKLKVYIGGNAELITNEE
jgi:hypothetical protein